MDLLETIKHNLPNCYTILISAWPTFESAARAMQYKTFAYLAKPVKKENLLETVSRAAEKAREDRLMDEYIRLTKKQKG